MRDTLRAAPPVIPMPFISISPDPRLKSAKFSRHAASLKQFWQASVDDLTPDELKKKVSARHAKIFALLQQSDQGLAEVEPPTKPVAKYVDDITARKFLSMCHASLRDPQETPQATVRPDQDAQGPHRARSA